MNKHYARLGNLARSAHARATVAAGLAMSSALANAQTADPITTLFDAVDFSGITAKIVALGVVVIGIVIAFKGVDIVKRIVRKV